MATGTWTATVPCLLSNNLTLINFSDRGCREHKKMVISPNDERCFTMKDIQNVASFQCFQNKD